MQRTANSVKGLFFVLVVRFITTNTDRTAACVLTPPTSQMVFSVLFIYAIKRTCRTERQLRDAVVLWVGLLLSLWSVRCLLKINNSNPVFGSNSGADFDVGIDSDSGTDP